MLGLLSSVGNLHQCKMAFLDCQRLEKHRRALHVAPRRFEPATTVRAMSAATSIGEISQPSSLGGSDEPRVNLRKKRKAVRLDGFRPAVGLCIVNNDGLVFAARYFPTDQSSTVTTGFEFALFFLCFLMNPFKIWSCLGVCMKSNNGYMLEITGCNDCPLLPLA